MLYQLNHLRIRTKILVCAAAIVVLVVILASVVYIDIAESEAREERVVRAADIVQSSDALRNDLTTMELSFRSYLLTGDENFANSYEQRAQTEQQEQLRLGQLVGDDASQVDQLDLLDVAVRDWRSAVQQPTIESHRAGEFTSGTALFTATATRDAQDFAQIEQQLTSIRTIEQQRSDAERQNAQDANDALRLALLIGTLLTAVLSVGTLWLLSTNIARRVQRVTTAATRIARGEAGVRCELPDSRDEVGLMGTTFNTMAQIIEERTADLVAQREVAEISLREAQTTRTELATQLALVEQQQAVIRDMSVPVLPIRSSTLVMPLVGALDSARLSLMHEQALQAIERARTQQLILDITGVPVIDTQVAKGLTQLVQAARLLGTTVDLVGIRPEVAQTLVGLGVELRMMRTFSNLQSALDR